MFYGALVPMQEPTRRVGYPRKRRTLWGSLKQGGLQFSGET